MNNLIFNLSILSLIIYLVYYVYLRYQNNNNESFTDLNRNYTASIIEDRNQKGLILNKKIQ